jgi:hypothetical protein
MSHVIVHRLGREVVVRVRVLDELGPKFVLFRFDVIVVFVDFGFLFEELVETSSSALAWPTCDFVFLFFVVSSLIFVVFVVASIEILALPFIVLAIICLPLVLVLVFVIDCWDCSIASRRSGRFSAICFGLAAVIVYRVRVSSRFRSFAIIISGLRLRVGGRIEVVVGFFVVSAKVLSEPRWS